jgi:hypothetical protein
MKEDRNDQITRDQALSYAIKTGATPDQVLELAKTFYDFLKGAK